MLAVAMQCTICDIDEQTVYASTSGRRMDADKGPKERSVYPALCWAVDDYADVFIFLFFFIFKNIAYQMKKYYYGFW